MHRQKLFSFQDAKNWRDSLDFCTLLGESGRFWNLHLPVFNLQMLAFDCAFLSSGALSITLQEWKMWLINRALSQATQSNWQPRANLDLRTKRIRDFTVFTVSHTSSLLSSPESHLPDLEFPLQPGDHYWLGFRICHFCLVQPIPLEARK